MTGIPLLVVNQDICMPGTAKYLDHLGINYILTEGLETPAVQIVPTKEDRRFTAAVAALPAVLQCGRVTCSTYNDQPEMAARIAVATADALLAELAK